MCWSTFWIAKGIRIKAWAWLQDLERNMADNGRGNTVLLFVSGL